MRDESGDNLEDNEREVQPDTNGERTAIPLAGLAVVVMTGVGVRVVRMTRVGSVRVRTVRMLMRHEALRQANPSARAWRVATRTVAHLEGARSSRREGRAPVL